MIHDIAKGFFGNRQILKVDFIITLINADYVHAVSFLRQAVLSSINNFDFHMISSLL